MNEETAVPKEVKLIPPHCLARTPSGRRCRMAISDPQTGLCFRHAAVHLKENSGDFSEALVCGINEFHSAVDINHVLGELYKLLAADKISPRRGAVMAYTCSLLLRTLPAIDEELNPDNDPILFDLPRPRHDDVSPEPASPNPWPNSASGARRRSPPTATTAGLHAWTNPMTIRRTMVILSERSESKDPSLLAAHSFFPQSNRAGQPTRRNLHFFNGEYAA